MSARIISTQQLEWQQQGQGHRFQWRRKSLSQATGGEKLGCSLYEIPPGSCSWPYHYHHGNEEAIYILAGTGTLRLACTERSQIPVAAGDYIALPVGADSAHQLLNTGQQPLQYLCFSTMIAPDVVVYPDSDKVGVFAGSAPGAVGAKGPSPLQKFFPQDEAVSYWQGEG